MEQTTRPDNHSTNANHDHNAGFDTNAGYNTSHVNQGPARRLYRTEGPISGVSGGIADYFNVDASLVRLAIAGGSLVTFPALPLVYLAAWMIIPEANPAPVQPIMAPSAAPTGNPVPPAPTAPVSTVTTTEVDTVSNTVTNTADGDVSV